MLADGTKARAWLGVVDASRLNRLSYAVFVRAHATAAGTQVVLYVVGEAERQMLDKDVTDIVARLKAGLAAEVP